MAEAIARTLLTNQKAIFNNIDKRSQSLSVASWSLKPKALYYEIRVLYGAYCNDMELSNKCAVLPSDCRPASKTVINDISTTVRHCAYNGDLYCNSHHALRD